jgi:diacylglycerol kinase family enzyme
MADRDLWQRPTLIVNPFAFRVTEERVRRVEAELRPVETLLTDHRGHAIELAREATGDAVWVLGGDGLVNEVLNGVRPGVPVGIVAAGHTNVLARALGITAGPLGGRQPRQISLGRVNDRRFTFAAGIGVDSETVRAMETERRAHNGRRPGDLAYAFDIAGRLVRGYEPVLEVRGAGRVALLFVSNDTVYTYGGPMALRICPGARFELGLDYVALERVGPRSLGGVLGRLFSGRGLAGAPGALSGHDVDRIEVVCDRPRPLQADGEDLGDVTEAVFEAERDAVSLLV